MVVKASKVGSRGVGGGVGVALVLGWVGSGRGKTQKKWCIPQVKTRLAVT